MKTILACLLATTLLATIARADVFVYRGVDKIAADASIAVEINGQFLNVYYVVDYDAGQTGQILYGRVEGAKRFTVSSASTSNFTTANLLKGKVASIIVSGDSTNTSPTNFSNDITFFRGTNTSLLIRKTPSHTTALRPSVLKGTNISASSGQTFSEQHIGLTFQGAPTIQANNASQTIDQVLDTLAAQLTTKGFISL